MTNQKGYPLLSRGEGVDLALRARGRGAALAADAAVACEFVRIDICERGD